MTKRRKSGVSLSIIETEGEMPAGGGRRRMAALIAYIDQLQNQLGINDAETVRRGGGKADAIRDIRRGVVPGSRKLSMIARGLGIPVTLLHNLVEKQPDPAITPESRRITAHPSKDLVDGPHSRRLDEGILDLPLLRQGRAGMTDALVSNISRPNELIGRSDAYALYVSDDRNAPMVRMGHVAYIDPSRPTVLDAWVRVFPVGEAPFIALLTERTAESVSLKVLSELAEISLRTPDLVRLERVVGFMLLDL